MNLQLSKHAQQRWQERCPSRSLDEELRRAKRISPKRLARLRVKANNDCECLMGRKGIVFICRGDLVVTVYRIHGKIRRR
jgi:hypothetical protein